MATFIPFLNSEMDCDLLKREYHDAPIVRVGLDSYSKICKSIPASQKRWIDPAVDGYGLREGHHEDWRNFIGMFPYSSNLFDPATVRSPDPGGVQDFVDAILTMAQQGNPAWISVPQFPQADDSVHNKINRLLAQSTSRWKQTSKFNPNYSPSPDPSSTALLLSTWKRYS